MYTDFNIIHGILISFKDGFIYFYYFCPLVLGYFSKYVYYEDEKVKLCRRLKSKITYDETN